MWPVQDTLPDMMAKELKLRLNEFFSDPRLFLVAMGGVGRERETKECYKETETPKLGTIKCNLKLLLNRQHSSLNCGMEICGCFNYIRRCRRRRWIWTGEFGRDPNAKVVVTSVCFNEPRRI